MSKLLKNEVVPWSPTEKLNKDNIFYGRYLQIRHNHIFYNCLELDLDDTVMKVILKRIKRKHNIHIFLTWRTYTIQDSLVKVIQKLVDITKKRVILHYPKEANKTGIKSSIESFEKTARDNLKDVSGLFEAIAESTDVVFKYTDTTNVTIRYNSIDDVYNITDINDISKIIQANKAYVIKSSWDFMVTHAAMENLYTFKGTTIPEDRIIKPDLAGRMLDIQKGFEGIPTEDTKADLADVMLAMQRQLNKK